MDNNSYGQHQLPATAPPGVPEEDWGAWRSATRGDAKPHYEGWFPYEVSTVWLLPEVHRVSELGGAAADAFWRLVLVSLRHWPADWERLRLTKADGNAWTTHLASPLKYWLMTKPWLRDRADTEGALSRRWLVPELHLLGQPDRFAHLHPLSVELARVLQRDDELRTALTKLGLNVYPVEDARVGPRLLHALADAWNGRRVPPRRFDVFLGQVRDGWRHLDPGLGLPTKYLVRTGRRTFEVRGKDHLADVYLPDHRERTRSLRDHGKPVLEMSAADALRLADVLTAQAPLRRASNLEERVLIDGARWTGEAENGRPLGEGRYAWVAPVLLTIAAHGGTRPSGASTHAWRDAAERLRRARVLECESIAVQLIDDDGEVASGDPGAHWVTGDVLAVRREVASSYESLGSAAQAILDRQDLLKDLRLVLGALAGVAEPSPEQIEAALERAEIDAQAFADVRHRWGATTSTLIDRVRPVLAVLNIPADGLDGAAAEEHRLVSWLSERLPLWPAEDLLASARRSRDDAAMGQVAWEVLGEVAQLPAWNKALERLGDRYVLVENRKVKEQAATHLDRATPYLRALARHAATAAGEPPLFLRIEEVNQGFGAPAEWAQAWWHVPLTAVIDVLRSGYAEVGLGEQHLTLLKSVHSVDDFATGMEAAGIELDPDPFETAAENTVRLDSMKTKVRDLHDVWREVSRGEVVHAVPPEVTTDVDPVAYLRAWTEEELFDQALRATGDAQFITGCEGCSTVEEARDRLGLDAAAVAAQRTERLRKQREEERQRRTFDVAGASFEVGTSNYQELFDRLCGLAQPTGPSARDDAFSPLAEAPAGGSGHSGAAGAAGKSSHRRPSAELRELVGVVGEIHAYRFLRSEFGTRSVARDAWVSEIRLKVLPPVPGEPETTSDGYGFDFRFRSGGKTWHVEVKASQGEEPQFDLGIREIEAASRLAGDSRQPWRILRISRALSDSPGFEWLPNPFEEGFRKLFRLDRAGMHVLYVRKKP